MNKLIVIAGPTAVGKTDLAIGLAQALKTEIISADSVQIFKDLNVGSAKPSHDEMKGIKHHLLDFLSPKASFSVSDYVNLAKKEIQRLHALGKIPVVVGGTGLYINGLLYEMSFGNSCSDELFRLKMEELYHARGADHLHGLLQQQDPEAAQRIHPNNLKRVIRALEIIHVTGKPMGDFSTDLVFTKDYEVILVTLTRSREVLYDRINRRVLLMLDAGLVDEVKNLKNLGLDDSYQSMQGIGYKEVLAYLNGITSFDFMVDDIQKGSRHYAKRQLTWFKRYPESIVIDLDQNTEEDAIKEILMRIE